MKSVLISIKPEWCSLIASGKKTVEVRKSRPKIETPFKVYIYCTKNGSFMIQDENNPALSKNHIYKYGGKVIGEFVCDEIIEINADDFEYGHYDISDDDLIKTRLTQEDLWEYGKGKTLYLWHISDLVIYDKPKELSEFYKYCNNDCSKCQFAEEYETNSAMTPWVYESQYACTVREKLRLKRPPQSWCYVEEMKCLNY